MEQIVFQRAKVSSMQLTLGASARVSLKDESGARKMRAVISLKYGIHAALCLNGYEEGLIIKKNEGLTDVRTPYGM